MEIVLLWNLLKLFDFFVFVCTFFDFTPRKSQKNENLKQNRAKRLTSSAKTLYNK
jgi:hypothetical protein